MGLVNMPKYGVFSGEPTQGKNKSSMTSGLFRWRSLGRHIGLGEGSYNLLL